MPFDPYENPLYRGAECDGLDPDAAFDLAKQMRMAARNRRIAAKLDAARAKHDQIIRYWSVVIAIALILAGISATMTLIDIWPR